MNNAIPPPVKTGGFLVALPMTRNIEIIKQSKWKTGKGVDPHCIALLKITKSGLKKTIEFTTHEMVMRPGKTEPELYLGHYFTKPTEAEADFNKRSKL